MTKAETARSSRTPFRNAYILFALLIPAVLLAFAPTYFKGQTFSRLPVTTLVHLHTALMALWVLMLIGQAWFIRTKRYAVHRWVGRSSFVVVPLIVAATLMLTIESLNRRPEIAPMDARIEIYTWGQVIPFVLAWGLALWYRRRTPIHVRFMVSTIFAAGSAIVFRIILNWFQWVPGMENIENAAAANGAVLVLMLLALIVNDWRIGIRRSPFWLVTITTVIMHIGFFTFTKSEWWVSFVQWYADLGR
jgi:hypothetical protein